MEEILFFLKSVNRIAIVAFVATLGFIIYEVYLLLRAKKRNAPPSIPEFKANTIFTQMKTANKPFAETPKSLVAVRSEKKNIVIILLLTLVLIFLAFFVVFYNQNNQSTQQSVKTVSVVTSDGIKLFSQDWKEIDAASLQNRGTNETIYITIATIQDIPIDKARIRINSSEWTPTDETTRLKDNYFYREYRLPKDQYTLNIEAQLHSKSDGWLGE